MGTTGQAMDAPNAKGGMPVFVQSFRTLARRMPGPMNVDVAVRGAVMGMLMNMDSIFQTLAQAPKADSN